MSKQDVNIKERSYSTYARYLSTGDLSPTLARAAMPTWFVTIFYLSGIGVIIMKRWLTIMLALLFLLLSNNAIGEEITMQRYEYNDIISYLKQLDSRYAVNGMEEHSIYSYTNGAFVYTEDSNVAVDLLFEKFPNYKAIRDNQDKWQRVGDKYAVYDLIDDSVLFVFIRDSRVESAWRMTKRCTQIVFDTLIPGVSTAEDVIRVDRNSVFSPFLSYSPVSFHCLEDDVFAMIKYENNSDWNTLIKWIKIIPKEMCAAIIISILTEDMP